jgi:hypothetical protein
VSNHVVHQTYEGLKVFLFAEVASQTSLRRVDGYNVLVEHSTGTVHFGAHLALEFPFLVVDSPYMRSKLCLVRKVFTANIATFKTFSQMDFPYVFTPHTVFSEASVAEVAIIVSQFHRILHA